jgi:putative membrane protein
MLKHQSLSWIALFVTFAVGTALAAENGMVSKQDKHFMMEASQGGMMEVQLGQYAAEHATNADVRSFGQRMVKDHTAINAKLVELAGDKGVKLSTTLDKKNQKMMDKLTGKKGSDFDTAYMKAMLHDHHKDIDAFEKEAQKTDDGKLKDFINDALPTLREHLALAKTIAPKVGVEK